jgi:hypothetical protein
MRKAISVLLFSIQLFGNEIVKCSGEGRTESEAIVNAQRKALQSFNTKLKVHFQKDISVVDREAKEKIAYKLETSSNGVVSLLLPEVIKDGEKFLVKGICQINNNLKSRVLELQEKISSNSTSLSELQNGLEILNFEIESFQKESLQIDAETEKRILKLLYKLENLEDSSKHQKEVLKLEIDYLQRDLKELKTVTADEVQNQILELQNDLENLPDISEVRDSLLYQIRTNFRVLNEKIEVISDRFEESVSNFKSEQKEKIDKLENSISTISSEIENLESRVSILEKYQIYIFSALALLFFLILFLLFRKRDSETEKIADIHTIDNRVKIELNSKILTSKEKLRATVFHKFKTEMYLYIVNLNSENRVEFLYPTSKDNNLIPPNRTLSTPDFDITQPFGKDIFKVIASPLPLEIPKIAYKSSKIFADSRGFKNPEIESIQKELAESSEVSNMDII